MIVITVILHFIQPKKIVYSVKEKFDKNRSCKCIIEFVEYKTIRQHINIRLNIFIFQMVIVHRILKYSGFKEMFGISKK